MATKEFFTLRLNQIDILNNKEWGPAEVKILSFITLGNESLPSLEGFLEVDDDQKKDKLKAAAENIATMKEFIRIDDVKDETKLTFGSEDAGISVYTAGKVPIDINWQLVLVERDADVRWLGSKIGEIVGSQEFDNFAIEIIETATESINLANLAYKIGRFVALELGKILANNKDDQIGVFLTSLNIFEHYGDGKRRAENVRGVNGNIFVDYTLFWTKYDV